MHRLLSITVQGLSNKTMKSYYTFAALRGMKILPNLKTTDFETVGQNGERLVEKY